MNLAEDVEGFWDRILIGDGCWEWQGFRRRDNYGMVRFRKRTYSTHRLAWQLWNDRPPEPGLGILHTCDNPSCCRPDHLYEGTQADNMRDTIERRRHHNVMKTVCPQGHPYDEVNTAYYQGPGRKRPQRMCKACRKTARQTRRAKKKA